MDVARKVFVGLAWLFVLAVAIQFLLAGLGVLGGESLEAHRQWGFIVLHFIPILMFIAAIVGPMGRGGAGVARGPVLRTGRGDIGESAERPGPCRARGARRRHRAGVE